MSTQKRDTLVSWISESQMRPEAKERALAILRRVELAEEDTQTILDIIQADIEVDFALMPGVNEALETDASYASVVSEQEEEFAEVEATVNEAATFIEAEVARVDALEGELTKQEDGTRLGDVKSRLGME